MITDDLTAVTRQAVFAARDAGEFSLADEDLPIKWEMPPNKQFGDYSTNIALTLKRATGLNDSRAIALAIQKHLPIGIGLIERVEVAGPGFLNFYLKPTWLQDILLRVEAEDERYGTNRARAGERVLIEFVSANPTGPISVVNGRAAVLGDVLGNLLAAQGCEVGREFYINDALNSLQLELFAAAVKARYLQQLGYSLQMPNSSTEQGVVVSHTIERQTPVEFPPKGYLGEYVRDIAREIVDDVGARYELSLLRQMDAQQNSEEAPLSPEDQEQDRERDLYFRQVTLQRMVATQRRALDAFGVHFDRWFFESSLYESGAVDEVIRKLKERGYTYTKGGALWLTSSAFGDDEDRVLVRSNEKATYIAADAAYHEDKFGRGYTHLIDIFGADHHGYVSRLKASIAALGYDLTQIDVILTQMVSLVRDGEAVIGGKRQGNVIELKEDLIDDIGKDAARFYFLLNSYETPATVDVELARRQSNENPVYYVQYAHARLCNIVRRAEEQGLTLQKAEQVDRTLLMHPKELDVLRKLSDYPEEVTFAAAKVAPHRLPRYAMELAGLLNLFYENCRVLPGNDETISPELTSARLSLVNGARIVLNNLLTLIGVSAPERMDRPSEL